MYVPFVPIVPSTVTSMTNSNNKVINKTIVYSDTVLNLKELGNNLKVTSIDDVKAYDFEKCVKLIFESNKDVTFNTIQYSKEKNKVYFYANKEIDTNIWEENKIFKYKPITNKTEILEEVKKILVNEKTSNPDVITINHVYDVIYKYVNEFKEMKEKYRKNIKYKLKSIYSDYASCCIHDFKYDEKILPIHFKKYSFDNDYDELEFSKNNDDLYVSKSSTVLYKDDYLKHLGDIISELYDELIKYEYINDYKYGTRLVNSNFYIDISKYGLTISNNKSPYANFELSKNTVNNTYNYKCNSNTVISAIEGNEDELFNRIYVNISDCPKWMQEELSILRYNELKEEANKKRKIQEQKELEEFERLLKERRHQKILNLKHKIFPWTKK